MMKKKIVLGNTKGRRVNILWHRVFIPSEVVDFAVCDSTADVDGYDRVRVWKHGVCHHSTCGRPLMLHLPNHRLYRRRSLLALLLARCAWSQIGNNVAGPACLDGETRIE